VEVIELSTNIGTIARDHGLRRARGRFTLFLDSDAALTEGALPAMVEAMDRNPGWGLIGPRLVGDDGVFSFRVVAFRHRCSRSSAAPAVRVLRELRHGAVVSDG
jgi:GT2 family glycosyltransferase